MTYMHEPYPVRVGEYVIYCEKFRAVGVKNFSEQNTVSGEEIITNCGKKYMRINFSGRIAENNPVEFIPEINGMMYYEEGFDVEYRGVVFRDCRVQSFAVDDANEGYISANLTLISSGVTAENEVGT